LQLAGADLVTTMTAHAIKQWHKRVRRARKRGARMPDEGTGRTSDE
jgi:hypothetical protein